MPNKQDTPKSINATDVPRLDLNSTNPQSDLLAYLHARAPEIFTEGKIDAKKLKATLGEEVESNEERYGLNWAGKAECFKRIQETVTDAFKPSREESVDFDTTKNLFIEGENLVALKALERSYQNKVKMIYIDPPYNTGNDFIYNDSFAQQKREYLQQIGAIDEHGYVVNANLYRQNTRDSGHFHSNWLNMMYPRLFVARNLLRPDGVIFVSIDDNEVKNLRMIMDEIFGEENFVAQVVWQKKYSPQNDDKSISALHEYLVVYSKSTETWKPNLLERTEEGLSRYKNPDNDPRGPWKAGDLTSKTKASGHSYPITSPSGKEFLPTSGRQWAPALETFQTLRSENRIWFGPEGKSVPALKQFLSEVQQGTIPTALWLRTEAGDNQEATKEMKELFNGVPFDAPKPVRLLKRALLVGMEKEDIVLDFFAGSGTTAHAIMQLNAEDGGNRICISIQLPEKCKPETEAEKAGFATIADIAKERVRRAGSKIKEQYPDKKLDTGFRVFKLSESSFKVWDPHVTPENLEQQMMEFLDNVRVDATNENLLYELILKTGHELTAPIEKKEADGNAYFRIGDGSVVIILDKVTLAMFEEILKEKPKKVLALERAFGGDDVLMTNIYLRSRDEGVEEMRVV